jgi:putative hemolysin
VYTLTIVIPDSFPLVPSLILVAVAAFFSATETAFFSLSRIQLRQIKEKTPHRFQKIKFLLDRPAAFVATVLLGNELSNVLISNIIAGYYESRDLSPALITVLNLCTVMPIIMIVGEITPKVLAAKANILATNLTIGPLWWFYRISFPIRFLLEGIVNIVTKPMRRRLPPVNDQIKEEDIRALLDEGKRKGAIHSIERDIIENVFEIDDDSVVELATPIRDCFTVHQNDTVRSVIDRLRKAGQHFYARIPVRGEQFDRVVGVLYAKDLLNHLDREDTATKVKHLMKEPLVVNPTMKVETLFRRFRQNKRHIAVIQDKNGRALAVVTMEDILEQMFGELWVEK